MAYQQFMTQALQSGSPMLIEAASQPDNLEMGKEFMGLSGLVIPAAEARNKQLREIEQLLEEQPIPPDPLAAQQAMSVGQPPPQPQSSVPIDQDYDFHQYEFQKVQEWLSSTERVQQEKAGNVAGIANVRLHGLLHKAQVDAAAQKAAAAAQPPPKPVDDKPSESINYKDLPPHGQIQLAAKAGIQIDPQVTSAIHPAMQPPPPPPVIKGAPPNA
jgi:hypothetical protein